MALVTRLLPACALLGAFVLAAGDCGEAASGAPAPAGSQPAVVRAASASGGGVEPTGVQRADPESGRVSETTTRAPKQVPVCSLVTRSEAQKILARSLRRPLEAPQGPTCIYRAQSTGRNLATVAVQAASIAQLRRQMRHAHTVHVGRRVAYCGTLGRPTLLLGLPGGRVLTITASCTQAKRFAARALPRLTS